MTYTGIMGEYLGEPHTTITPGSDTLFRVWCHGWLILPTNDLNRALEVLQLAWREERRAKENG